MAQLDYSLATEKLEDLFRKAEAAFLAKSPPRIPAEAQAAADLVFASSTQSYREVLLGCGLARILDRSINIRHPYVSHGDGSFNGRTLDERVVNPFLQDRMIPCSKGPYLASFRRSIRFVPETASGLRDKNGYKGLLAFIEALDEADEEDAKNLVVHLLFRFLQLRDEATIPLSRISRLSLEQYRALVSRLLQTQSGGLVPVLLTVGLLRTIKACYGLAWEVDWQEINVADKASGAGGDVTVSQDGNTLLAIEVTERIIEESRVVSTFNTKIVQVGIKDYLFVYSTQQPTSEAKQAAQRYFSQGHEINFLSAEDWIVNNLATLGANCRAVFTREILNLLESSDVPSSVKMAWNDIVKGIVSP